MGITSNEDRGTHSNTVMNPEIRVTLTMEPDTDIPPENISEQEQAVVSVTENRDSPHLGGHSFSEGNFHRMISETIEINQERRNSLPAGFLEHGAVNNLCGKILRFMGDEHFSKTCGKHLRCMGDEMCYTYLLKNMMPTAAIPPNSGTQEHHIANSHSMPDLSHFSGNDKHK